MDYLFDMSGHTELGCFSSILKHINSRKVYVLVSALMVSGAYLSLSSGNLILARTANKIIHLEQSECVNSDVNFKSNFLLITIKTTSKFHLTRLKASLDTWIPAAISLCSQQGAPVISSINIVSDGEYLPSDNKFGKTFQDDSVNVPRLYWRNAAFCGSAHDGTSLTCKLQEELRLFFPARVEKAAWFCHFDDDMYVNTPNLLKALAGLGNPFITPVYMGKESVFFPNGYKINTSLDISGTKPMRPVHFASGNAFCLSQSLMSLMQDVIQMDDHKFNFLGVAKRLDQSTGDDLILGIFVTEHLLVPLTSLKNMYSQFDRLEKLRPSEVYKAITLSHSIDGGTFRIPGHNGGRHSQLNGTSFSKKFKALHRYLRLRMRFQTAQRAQEILEMSRRKAVQKQRIKSKILALRHSIRD